jgi:hypothetical protein
MLLFVYGLDVLLHGDAISEHLVAVRTAVGFENAPPPAAVKPDGSGLGGHDRVSGGVRARMASTISAHF